MGIAGRVFIVVSALSAAAAAQQPAARRALQHEARVQELWQLELDSRYRVNADVPIEQRALIDYGGYFNFNYLSLDDNIDDNHVLREYDFVAYTRILLDNSNEIFLRFRTGYRDFNDGDSFDGQGDEVIDPDLDRAYHRFDLGRAKAAYQGQAIETNVIVKTGRDLAYWANGLVLAQVLDGLTINLENPNFDVQLLGGQTITRTVDFDPSRPAFDHNTKRGFFGAMLTGQVQNHSPFIYGLIQRDWNEFDESLTGPITTKFDYQSYYIGLGSSGNLSDRLHYGVEFAYELGNTLSNSFDIVNGVLVQVPQQHDDISAWALDARLDYAIPDEHQSRLSLELILATGDSDRGTTNATFNGNQPGSGDHAFNAFGLLNTGLAFGPAVSNLMALRVGAATFPFGGSQSLQRLQVGTDFFVFGKFDEDAPIDEPTFDKHYLGVEPDVYLNWQMASDITLALRYGIFFPSSSAFPSDEARQFIYAGVTFAF